MWVSAIFCSSKSFSRLIFGCEDNFEKELSALLTELSSQPKINLEKLLDEQKIAETHINSRPGAMALAQNKIQMFNEYNQKYIASIKEKLDS